MTSTYLDLFKFQKDLIVSRLTESVMRGKAYTWSVVSGNTIQPVTVYLDEQSDVPVTLPKEVERALRSALETFNRAPNGYHINDFLYNVEGKAA
jgi:uncharacterized FAD-dependent dehydrogenase